MSSGIVCITPRPPLIPLSGLRREFIFVSENANSSTAQTAFDALCSMKTEADGLFVLAPLNGKCIQCEKHSTGCLCMSKPVMES